MTTSIRYLRERMQSSKVDSHTDLILKVTPLKLFLDMASSSYADVTTRVAWMYSPRIKLLGINLVCIIRVRRGLAISRLFPGILKVGNEL